jgi:hypothetical protein
MAAMRCHARLSLALVLFIICAATGTAQQTKCALTPGQSPKLSGLRLGMTLEQIKARFKIIEEEEADDFGVAKLQLDPSPDVVEAVRDIAIELIRERIVSIRLVQNPLESTTAYREYTERLSGSLQLPQAWKPVTHGSTVTGMTMECAGFKVNATLIGMRIPVVYMYSLEAEPTLLRRQAEKEKRLRDFFKP